MTIKSIHHRITGDTPGLSYELNGFRFGPENASRKVYLQGSLHADEQPGMMALIHLLPLLEEADKHGQLNCEFVVFPMVNPIGMATIEFREHQGRYDRPSGVNFNRQWPDIFNFVKDQLDGKLGSDLAENTDLIRSTAGDWLKNASPVGARQTLRNIVLQESCDADYVFDLHCDGITSSCPHIFSASHCNEAMKSLSGWIGVKAILTADDSGGGSFDEVWPLLWNKVKQIFPEASIPTPVVACTLELRGNYDVSDELGSADAKGLFGFFQSEGLIEGNAGKAPHNPAQPTLFTATEMLRVEQPGLLSYLVKPGDSVTKGQPIADLIALDGENAFKQRQKITAGTDGLVISTRGNKYVWSGCSIAKIVGTDPLPERAGYLLED
ncbi:MAG: putative deacylase [Parasphingorhabdus sp.]|jgi:predicted deacylase